ncbi:RagB/SusD family nutrient uptake outer membrane protein [Paraflavisolibacter sp. H34]|uniref:RagB/SusD family nutrient uptake outer membrane protein n=1 Tax=Huijunlia imazamoxiresistens TaxID=3127457 RepID=UPI003016BFEB
MRTIFPLILLTVFISITGCRKFLEQEPDNRTNVTTAEQITQLLVSAYPKASYFAFCESLSDNAEDKGRNEPGLDAEFVKMNQQTWNWQDVQSTSKDSPEAYWDSCYRAIAAANQALQVIRNAPDSTVFSAQRGEALVARAYAHFMLAALFTKAYEPTTAASDPGIPYVTRPETEVFGQYQRHTVKYVYDMIEADLTTGLSLINDNIYGNAPKFHFTKKAAHAFASRFYLWKREYAKVVEHANQALTGTTADNLRAWNGEYQNFQPGDMQLAYTNTSERANILLQEVSTFWSSTYAAFARYSLYSDVQSMVLNGPNPSGGSFAIGFKVFGAQAVYYNVPKFKTSGDGTNEYGIIPLFTAEEVVLNRAEALTFLQQNDAALADLNAWCSKNIRNYNAATHTITQTKLLNFWSFYNLSVGEALLETIIYFRQVFFIHEGMRWLDVVRLNFPIQHTTSNGQTFTLPSDDKRRLLQLPSQVTASGVALNPR